MTTKERIKNEIDQIPDELLEDVLKFISNIRSEKKVSGKLHTYKLKGRFDNLNIREAAYE